MTHSVHPRLRLRSHGPGRDDDRDHDRDHDRDRRRDDHRVGPVGHHFTRLVTRVALGSMLVFAGTGHLTWAREEFRAQVPDSVPLDADMTVLVSGVVEIALGSALVAVPRRHRRHVGRLAAFFFVGVFPGNVSQFLHARDGFGLDTDARRFARLLLQPVLVWSALYASRD
ncbi:MAG: DoxX protein [Propionibacterium sp.]|nr:DoxX protein [Propionibacterium sp.]